MKEQSRRHFQVGEAIKRELARMFLEGRFSGICPGRVSINEVRPSRGYEHATVFVRAFCGKDTSDAVRALNDHAATIRYELAQSMSMRSTPELRFKADESEDEAARIEELLKQDA
ncbi:MAG: 30S ribosome-binding factor RbfA [Rickettsiales bacterium]|jgi:ribosome-binding factor A|nr:30S ribosome-binding factor RbfA [Rickettsiales bacterium]